MKIGIHTFIWCNYFEDEALSLIDKAKRIGYDSFEVVVGPAQFDAGALANRLRSVGMDATMSSTVDAARAATGADAEMRRKAREFFRRCFDIAGVIGARNLVGPLHYNGLKVGPRKDEERREEWLRAVETLRFAAEDASEAGITLCIEPVNRYKSDLVNTAADAMRMIDDIGMDNVKILFDTYHANIEENSLTGAIEAMGLKYLGEVHVCDNDKGAPGSGHIDFKAVADTLRRIGYDGNVVFESFVPFNKDNIWRRLAPTQDDLASDGLKYIRTVFK